MTCIATAEICIPQHDAKDIYIDVVDENGLAVDISTASEITFIVAVDVEAVAILVTKTLTGGGLSLQTSSQIKVPFDSADTGLAAGVYYHETRVVNVASDPATVLSGAFEIQDTRIGDP